MSKLNAVGIGRPDNPEHPQPTANTLASPLQGLRPLASLLRVYTGVESTGHPPQEKGRKGKWGGARLKANRTTTALTTEQIVELKAATEHAGRIGLPLNRFITVHWQLAGVNDSQAAKATGQFLKRLKDWTTKQGHPTAFVWVRENGLEKGSHVHILAHVLPHQIRRLTRLQMKWVSAITGQRYMRRCILSRPIAYSPKVFRTAPEQHKENLDRVTAYTIKGASREAAAALQLDRQELGGLVVGKRCGTSENISRKARQNLSKSTA